MRHIYLDDLRACPEGWELVRTYQQCIEALREGNVDYLSLDHDLAEGHYAVDSGYFGEMVCKEPTGYDVCKWMVETDTWPSTSITLHTANPVGRNNMRQLLMRYKPDYVQVYG